MFNIFFFIISKFGTFMEMCLVQRENDLQLSLFFFFLKGTTQVVIGGLNLQSQAWIKLL